MKEEEEAGNFNNFIQTNLIGGKIDKRKKGDFVKTLETARQLLETEIFTEKTKNVETLFNPDTWTALHDAIESFDLNKNEEIRKISLQLLQIFVLSIPKRGKIAFN